MPEQHPAPAKTALITGASSGIGYELAKQFAKNHNNLVLVARNREALHKLADDLANQYAISAWTLSKDLANPTSPLEIFEELEKQSVKVDYLVNNAGFGLQGLFWELDMQSQQEIIQVNISSLTHLTRLFLPGMIQRRSGGILNVASTAAFQPGPLMAVYYASKAYVLSFTEALSNELHGTGVTATALCPGPTKTSFQKRARMGNARLFRRGVMDAEPVAEAGYRGLMKGKRVVIPGLSNRLLATTVKLVPRRMVLRMVRKLNESRENPGL
jgi:short-subunit dehydrogenase